MKIGLKDVAKEAGVSLSTASHALNGTAPLTRDVRERVIAAAQRLGYLEMRRNKASITALRSIVVAITEEAARQDDLNLVNWTLMGGLREECEKRAVRIVPCVSPGKLVDPARVKRVCQEERPQAVVVIHDDRPDLIRQLLQLPVPVVLVNGEDPSMRIDTITVQNRFGARLATEYLMSLGHRRILHMTWAGRTTIRRRHDGFIDAFLLAGLAPPTDFIIEAASYEPSAGEAAMRSFLETYPDRKGATAIFCAADNLALGCLKALESAGVKVPGQFSVFGCDDLLPATFSSPPLSTVHLPGARLGAAALDMIEQRLVSNDPLRPAQRLELGCKLVLRDSSAPPAKS
ncbi:LacI family transcriptional regulator [Allorhizobium sp. BGMRC 0089]|uniref:LacI family DNA-binding transcriptional regulator n=1 Tax=Allorhizobium sonneratiae TaxID=2934936 RepID=UPI002033C9D1|nr:LacI family DNA-binding transcriptional regulator [Allorhizobium sonneratiae]MCM2293856.1 LacI family transcriptional regulator [Allorhizobium sonneratiae]